jgi:ABC-type polysaccharide/polyol phosphate transport system ATPase subunit
MFDLEFLDVSKRYRIADSSNAETAGLSGKVARFWRKPADFWAIRDVTFRVSRGEALGIIGHNGAGKSTILKLLSNITTPSRGEIRIRRKIAGLLEVGSGFHPELTGRENVFLSGSILGMRRAEISSKLESIFDFAGVREFADVPVKRYSSGMYVRLGFSIAAHLEAGILLLDEVLAVGDAKFQEKCQRRILELKTSGTTIVFISHDLAAVRALCDRALLMNRGRLIGEGVPSDVIAQYARLGSERPDEHREGDSGPQRAAHTTSFYFLDDRGEPTTELRTGFPVRAVLEYEASRHIARAFVNALFYWSGDWSVSSHFTAGPLDLMPGTGAVEFTCDELTLGPGAYAVSCTIEDENGEIDFVSKTYFSVASGKPVRGKFFSPNQWKQLNEADIVPSKRGQLHDVEPR